MKRIVALLMGITFFLALSPFSYAADEPEDDAGDFPSFGPQTYQVHKYYYFGDDAHSPTSREGIDISIDPSSVSYQSVKATVTMDWNIINDRQITKFIVLANGINVDEFEPYFDTSLDPPVYKEYYYLDLNVSDQYIGSDVYFQVVALHQDSYYTPSSNVFVVGWSQETPTVRLKPLPVTDNDTHGLIGETNSLLDQILRKLDELKNMLLSKLDEVKDAIEKIYTVTPETQAKFDAALANLQSKLPEEQMKDQINQVKDLMDDSAERIDRTPQELKFGVINWMGATSTPAIDLTEVASQVEKLRRILQIALWGEFFYFIILILRPRLTV